MSDMTGEVDEELTCLTGADARYLEDHKISDKKMILVENYTEEDKPKKKKMLIHRNASINQYFNAYTNSNKSLTRNNGSPEKQDSLQHSSKNGAGEPHIDFTTLNQQSLMLQKSLEDMRVEGH